MGINYTFHLIVFLMLFMKIDENESQTIDKPLFPVSVLDDILRVNNTNVNTNNNNEALNMILGSLIPIMGSQGSTNTGNPENSTGYNILNFFRNIIAMFLGAVLQVFRVFQLLSRTITGNDGKKLDFLSVNHKFINKRDLSDKKSSDINNDRLERVIRQIQTSAEEFPLNFFMSDENLKEFEDQLKNILKSGPNFGTKPIEDILKSDSFKSNFKSGLQAIYRRKRQTLEKYSNELNTPINSLINQFVESHSHLNNDFHFEFPKNYE